MEYKLKSTRIHWMCDDGCCSDSWEELELYHGDKCLIDTDDLRGYNSEYNSPQEILDYVNRVFTGYAPDTLTLENCTVEVSSNYGDD